MPGPSGESMLYRIMISAMAEVTLYAEISASSREEANTLIQALNLDELEGDIDTIKEIGLTYITNPEMT